MFVFSSTHHELKIKYMSLMKTHNALVDRWNELVEDINRKGGEEFLKGSGYNKDSNLSGADVMKLIKLCHPDKHHGKEIATEMTRKLLVMRKKIKM